MGIEELNLAIEAARVEAVCAAERYDELAASAKRMLAQATLNLDRAHACLAKIAMIGPPQRSSAEAEPKVSAASTSTQSGRHRRAVTSRSARASAGDDPRPDQRAVGILPR